MTSSTRCMQYRKQLLSIGHSSANNATGRDKFGTTVRPTTYQQNAYYYVRICGGIVGRGILFYNGLRHSRVFFVCDKFFFRREAFLVLGFVVWEFSRSAVFLLDGCVVCVDLVRFQNIEHAPMS